MRRGGRLQRSYPLVVIGGAEHGASAVAALYFGYECAKLTNLFTTVTVLVRRDPIAGPSCPMRNDSQVYAAKSRQEEQLLLVLESTGEAALASFLREPPADLVNAELFDRLFAYATEGTACDLQLVVEDGPDAPVVDFERYSVTAGGRSFNFHFMANFSSLVSTSLPAGLPNERFPAGHAPSSDPRRAVNFAIAGDVTDRLQAAAQLASQLQGLSGGLQQGSPSSDSPAAKGSATRAAASAVEDLFSAFHRQLVPRNESASELSSLDPCDEAKVPPPTTRTTNPRPATQRALSAFVMTAAVLALSLGVALGIGVLRKKSTK